MVGDKRLELLSTRHWFLRPACLPIPPIPQQYRHREDFFCTQLQTLQHNYTPDNCTQSHICNPSSSHQQQRVIQQCQISIYVSPSITSAYNQILWRRVWDSNPGSSFPLAGFQDRCLKPTRPTLRNKFSHFLLCESEKYPENCTTSPNFQELLWTIYHSNIKYHKIW